MQDYIDGMSKYYVDFSGRARRRQYWMFGLFTLIALVAAGALDYLFGLGFEEDMPIGIIVIIVLLIHVIPSIAITVRRLHDIDLSGWWYLISLIPYVGRLILFVMTVLDSKPGKNKWGYSPKHGKPDELDDYLDDIRHLVD